MESGGFRVYSSGFRVEGGGFRFQAFEYMV
jgi:hypothetical protein